MKLSAVYDTEKKVLFFYEDSGSTAKTRKESVGLKILLLDSLLKKYDENEPHFSDELKLHYKKMQHHLVDEFNALRIIYRENAFNYENCPVISYEEASSIINRAELLNKKNETGIVECN